MKPARSILVLFAHPAFHLTAVMVSVPAAQRLGLGPVDAWLRGAGREQTDG